MYGQHLSDSAKNKISIANKGRLHSEEQKQKRLETLESHGGTGWWVTDEWKQSISKSKLGVSTKVKGYIHITNGQEDKMIDPCLLEEYEENGWKRGRKPFTEIACKNISEGHKGLVPRNKGTIVISNGTNELFVDPDEVDGYLSCGWKLGRNAFSEETKRKMSDAMKGRPGLVGWKSINNGMINKRVSPEDYPKYKEAGWLDGYMKK